MRIAVTIIAGGLTLVIALQSWTDRVGDGLSTNERLQGAGDAGWFVAFLYLLGSGFAYGVPALSVVMFGLAGVVSLGVAANRDAAVFGVWGVVALVLAGTSAFCWREKRRIWRRELVHRVIDEELVPMDAGRPSRNVDTAT
jgi:hypothetical protein